ncbi:MAG: hypothetical protein P8129_01105 [Anaerolineae bacterium]
MEKVTFNIPAMWADHHVLKVRQTLTQIGGVENVLASECRAITASISHRGWVVVEATAHPNFGRKV